MQYVCAHYHLNMQRHNALLSFDTFIGTPNSKDTRDYLIEEIARTIYSVHKIGYLSEDRKSMDISQVTELLKTLKP